MNREISKKKTEPTRVTMSMAEVGLLRSIAFFISMVVTLPINDEVSARIAAIIDSTVVD